MINPVITSLARTNDLALVIGRRIGVLAIALMVIAILVQVYFRYVLVKPLPWPEEAARFCMLWMTGLMAPSALRSGGFVAIDSLSLFLPALVGRALMLMLLVISLWVLIHGVQIGWNEVTGFGGKFKTASLYVPTTLEFDTWMRVPRSWMMASLLVGCVLMTTVTVELILRTLAGLKTYVDAPVVSGE